MKEPYIYTIHFKPVTTKTGIWPFIKTETITPDSIDIDGRDFFFGVYTVYIYGKTGHRLAIKADTVSKITSRENV